MLESPVGGEDEGDGCDGDEEDHDHDGDRHRQEQRLGPVLRTRHSQAGLATQLLHTLCNISALISTEYYYFCTVRVFAAFELHPQAHSAGVVAEGQYSEMLEWRLESKIFFG